VASGVLGGPSQLPPAPRRNRVPRYGFYGAEDWMARYLFALRHLDHDDLDNEPEGMDLPDDNTAREFALKIIRVLVQNGDENWEG
jgi:hypothetical protein